MLYLPSDLSPRTSPHPLVPSSQLVAEAQQHTSGQLPSDPAAMAEAMTAGGASAYLAGGGNDRIFIPASYFDGPLEHMQLQHLPLGMPLGLGLQGGGGEGGVQGQRQLPKSQTTKTGGGGGGGGGRGWLSRAASGPVLFGRWGSG